MKNFVIILLSSIILMASNQLSAQLTAKVYEDDNLEKIVKKHKTIAILPLDVLMIDAKPNKKKRASQEELDAKAKEYQQAFQNSMYSWFLKRKKKKKMVDVDIQDVDRTNTLLRKNGIKETDDMADYTKDEIATMLGVDAIFGGNVKTSATFSRGGAMALNVLTGISVRTGDADVFIKLWNGEDGKMIWSFDRTISSSSNGTTDDLVDYLMKRVSKRFPYEK